MGSLARRPHALVIPLPHQGHWEPMKLFIRQLVNLNVSFTILASPTRIAELQTWQSLGEFDSLEHVDLVTAFTDPPNRRFNRTVDTLQKMIRDFWAQPDLKKNLLAKQAAGYGPTFLVADMFLYWSQDVADQLGIPRYTFFTSPTTFTLLILHSPALIAGDWGMHNPEKCDEVVDIPGLDVFRGGDICSAVFAIPEIYTLQSINLPKAAGILINSFDSFEVAQKATLRSELEKVVGKAKIPSIFLVGPVQCAWMKPIGRSKKGLTAETDGSGCLKFLDSREATSVLYICFGSQAELDPGSIMELAKGLEVSQVPFLWVLPPPPEASNWELSRVLPEGFLSRIEKRGFVCTTWAPQPEILVHSSTGGFISHCGWNSLVESIRSGVPVIPWPIWADQLMNARFVTEVAKVAYKIRPNFDGGYKAEEIAKAVRALMVSDEGKDTRLNMQKLKRTVDLAVGEGGSSHKALQDFLQEVSSLSNN